MIKFTEALDDYLRARETLKWELSRKPEKSRTVQAAEELVRLTGDSLDEYFEERIRQIATPQRDEEGGG